MILANAYHSQVIIEGDKSLSRGVENNSCKSFKKFSGKEWKLSGKIPEASLRSLLSHYLDITSPPSQQFLKHLANLPDQERIEELISMGEVSKTSGHP